MPSLIPYPESDACLLYLVRHGATPHNLQKPPRLQGSGVDESLSDLGRQQAERVAEHLASRPLAQVFSSPLKRAQETAQAIASAHSIKVHTLESLKEVCVGDWEGMTWDEIQAEDPENYAKFMSDPAAFGYPGGETIASVMERTASTLAPLMADYIGKEIVAVAHSVVIRTYMGSLLGLDTRQGYYVPAMNCAVNLVRWKNGKAKPVTVNAVGHLM